MIAGYDRLGRRNPHKLIGFTVLRMYPWLLQHFDKKVPDEMTAIEGEEAVIPCPCGSEIRVRLACFASCDCGRHFFHQGKYVRVAREPE